MNLNIKKFLFCDYLIESEKDILNRITLFNIFLIIYIIAAIPFGIMNLLLKNYILASMLFAGIFINIGSKIFLCITKKHITAFTIAIFAMALLLLISYITGGINNNGPLWYFVFPVAVFILLGHFKGAIASIALLILSLLILMPPFSQIMKTDYSPQFLLLHSVAYIVVIIFAFSYEFQKQKTKAVIQNLNGIIPLCSWCKKVRDNKGLWEQIDIYINKSAGTHFSHSICPECIKEHFPE